MSLRVLLKQALEAKVAELLEEIMTEGEAVVETATKPKRRRRRKAKRKGKVKAKQRGRKPGRPKGSGKKRGRPKGSKNKKKATGNTVTGKRRGRPKGSKNKARAVTPEEQTEPKTSVEQDVKEALESEAEGQPEYLEAA